MQNSFDYITMYITMYIVPLQPSQGKGKLTIWSGTEFQSVRNNTDEKGTAGGS